MPRRTRKQPTASLKLEPDLLERVRREYRHVLAVLDSWRGRWMHRRLGAAEQQLGRSPGFLGHVVHERDTITVERLLGFIALAGRSLGDFVECLILQERIPSAPAPGYLRPYLPRQRRYESLAAWASCVELSPSGDGLDIDPSLVIRRVRENREAGLALAEQYLDVATALVADSVTPEAVASLSRVLGSLAFIQRERGDHAASSELIEIGFSLERRLEDLELRGLLYRALAYLLADLGEVQEAERCAQRARDLSLATPSAEGLAESLFARAMMVKWQGVSAEALKLFRAAKPHVTPEARSLQLAIHLQVAWLCMESQQLAEAGRELRQLDQELDVAPTELKAHSRAAWAEFLSLGDDEEGANSAFDEAERLFEACGSSGDKAVLLLRRCRHRLRFGRQHLDADAGMLTLAQKMRRGSAGEAALLEVARLVLAGSATDEVLRKAIEELGRPWTQRSLRVQGRRRH